MTTKRRIGRRTPFYLFPLFCFLLLTIIDFMRLLLYPTVPTTTGNSVSYTFSVEGSVGLMTGLGVTCYMTCWSLLESTVTSVDLCRSLPFILYSNLLPHGGSLHYNAPRLHWHAVGGRHLFPLVATTSATSAPCAPAISCSASANPARLHSSPRM